MVACRYEISLWVFNSIACDWDVELNMRREISYLQATMYYFVYHINTIALYWKKKQTSLMNENKWIDNPWITIFLGALVLPLKMEKYIESWLQK